MKHFMVYTNQHKDKDLMITGRIREYLEKRGRLCSSITEDRIEEVDCMIVLGGDGTMLQAAREFQTMNIPLIGVNLGILGYMTEIELSNLEEALERLINGEFELESRMMLGGMVLFRDGRKEEDQALNDIVITRCGSLKTIQYQIYVNNQFLSSYHADGVIVTTPTGSTGYNLSAGGPIVDPTARLIVLTPICPHTLSQRSIILSPEDVIEIVIPVGKEGKEQRVEASFDGSDVMILHSGDRIRIRKSEKTTEIIKLNKMSFLELLHNKLGE